MYLHSKISNQFDRVIVGNNYYTDRNKKKNLSDLYFL